MTNLTRESILAAAVESLEWAYAHGELDSDYEDTVNDWVHEAIDAQMIYTSDIMAAWAHYGYPEPDEMCESVSASVNAAVYNELWGAVPVADVCAAFIESHAGSDALADIDPTDDPESAMQALIEWRENN